MNHQSLKLECLKLAKDINGQHGDTTTVIKDARILHSFIVETCHKQSEGIQNKD